MMLAPPSQLLARRAPQDSPDDPSLDAVLYRVLDEVGSPSPASRLRPVRRRVLLAAGVGVLTASAVALPAALRRGDAGVQALERLAVSAATRPAPVFGPGQLLRVVVVENPGGGGTLISGEKAPPEFYPRTLESWTAADGTIWRRDTDGAGERSYYQFDGPDLFLGGPTLTPTALASLPTDPALLDRLLRPDQNATDESVFYGAVAALGTGFAPPAVRQALFDVLARLPDVVTTQARTVSGQPCLRVTYTGPDRGGRSQYACFDQDTTEQLETGDVIDGAPTFVALVRERRIVDAVPPSVLERSEGTPQG